MNKVYVHNIKKKKKNNQKVYEVLEKEENYKKNKLSVSDTLEELKKSNGYIFSQKVKIITQNKEYQTFIVSINNNSIITIDNDIIKIKDIQELIYL